MTRYGGNEGDGNIFSVATNGTDYQNLISFTGYGGTASGKSPLTAWRSAAARFTA